MKGNLDMMKTVQVKLGPRTYDIKIGPQIIDCAGILMNSFLVGRRVAIITDKRVGSLYLKRLESSLAASGIESVSLTLEQGESTKSWETVRFAADWLLSKRIEREDAVIALGGGVIGDTAGFVAAVIRRGIRYVQVPTTLLAQVDSSVGGKTGINSRHGKNLVGAFHQPVLVLTDISVLASLPRRDLLAGYSEVVKYGLLGSARFFDWLELNGRHVVSGSETHLVEVVARSCGLKAEFVSRDETEFGDRALLNLGHTFGHALEAATGYSGRLLHGEGVSIGCGLAFDLSVRLGLCPSQDRDRVRRHFSEMGMKADISDIPGDLPSPDTLITLMGQDKKVRQGENRLVLVRGIGRAFVESRVDPSEIRSILTEATERRNE